MSTPMSERKHMNPPHPALMQEAIRSLERERDKLQRFKDYVHKRLDDAGVPTDPESPHKAEGCRIGGRLDNIIGQRDELRAVVEKLPALRDGGRAAPGMTVYYIHLGNGKVYPHVVGTDLAEAWACHAAKSRGDDIVGRVTITDCYADRGNAEAGAAS